MKIYKIAIMMIFTACLGNSFTLEASIRDKVEGILGQNAPDKLQPSIIISCGIQDSKARGENWGLRNVDWEFVCTEPMTNKGKGPYTDKIRLNDADQIKPDKNGNFIVKPDNPSYRAISTFANVYRAYEMISKDIEDLSKQFPRNVLIQKAKVRWINHNGFKPLIITPVDKSETNNAFYNRNDDGSRVLSFFPISSPKGMGYTADSSEIVMHEAGHSILDILCPHFFDAPTGQVGALHEAFGDLVSTWGTLCHWQSVGFIAEQTQMNLNQASILSNVAEEFGQLLGIGEGLRNLDLDTNLKKTGTEVHAASQVLSGAIYDIMAKGVNHLNKLNLLNYRNKRPKIIHDVSDYLRLSFIQALITNENNSPTFKDLGEWLLKVVESHPQSFSEDMSQAPWETFIREEFISRDIMGEKAVRRLQKFENQFALLTTKSKKLCHSFCYDNLPNIEINVNPFGTEERQQPEKLANK